MYKKLAIGILIAAPLMASFAGNLAPQGDPGNASNASASQTESAQGTPSSTPQPQAPSPWSNIAPGQPMSGAGEPMVQATPPSESPASRSGPPAVAVPSVALPVPDASASFPVRTQQTIPPQTDQ